MAPLSMIANLMIGTSLAITMYYIFIALPAFDSVPTTANILRLPLFFGNAIFALEGIGVVSIFFYIDFKGRLILTRIN